MILKLPVRYLGSVRDFAAIAAADEVYIDPTEQFNKRDKETHRTAIADANGVIRLTVPIVKPQSLSKATIGDIRISPHDQWWNIHFTALASAYGRTPYFEYYADDFRSLYSAEAVGMPLVDFNARLNLLVSRLIQIPAKFIYDKAPDNALTLNDFNIQPVPYYQVRALRQGFIPDLSIADLLFNLGPEAITILDRMRQP